MRVREAALIAPRTRGVSMRSTSSAGISSRKREGCDRLVFAEDAPAGRAGEDQPLSRARHARRSRAAAPPRAPLRLSPDRECGNRPSSRPAMMTTGNSSPLAACMRHQPDPGFARPGLLVGLRQQRQPVDEAAERRLRLARSRTRAPPTRAPSGFRSARSASSLFSSRRSFR